MTKLLDEAIAKVRELPEEEQECAAESSAPRSSATCFGGRVGVMRLMTAATFLPSSGLSTLFIISASVLLRKCSGMHLSASWR